MASELMAGLSLFKAMFDSAKALKDINDATIRNGAIVELQEKLLAAHAAHFALIERVRDLEEKVADFETWNAEKQRYHLQEIAVGTFAYMLKPDAKPSEPPHYVCAACYQHRRKSILQRKPESSASIGLQKPPMYRCSDCNDEIIAPSAA